MAKDGRFYWVFVVAVPASNRRFLSVRFKPSTPLLGKVEALYKQMLQAENDVIAAGGKDQQAVAASVQVALGALKQLGFSDYDSFSQLALNQEMKARETCPKSTGVPAYDQVSALFRQLDGFVELALGLQQKTVAVLAIAGDFRLHAFNVNITSQRYGEAGKGLGVVAGFLGDCSAGMARSTDSLRVRITEVARAAEAINTRLAMAHLQMEMILFYKAEMVAKKGIAEPEEIKVIEECFTTSTRETFVAMKALREILPQLRESRDAIGKIALTIEMSQVLGHTETAHIPDGAALVGMFAEFRSKLAAARAQLEDLSAVIDKIAAITR
jgi:aerotaxis receptor